MIDAANRSPILAPIIEEVAPGIPRLFDLVYSLNNGRNPHIARAAAQVTLPPLRSIIVLATNTQHSSLTGLGTAEREVSDRRPANRRIPVSFNNPNSITVGNVHDSRVVGIHHRSEFRSTKPPSTNGDRKLPATAESPRPDFSDSTPVVPVSQEAELCNIAQAPALDLRAIAAAAIQETKQSPHQEEPVSYSTPVPVPANDSHGDPITRPARTSPQSRSFSSQPSATSTESEQTSSAIANPPQIAHPAPTPAAPASGANHKGNITGSGARSYVCTFDGCTASAFPTQYLLDSHTLKHSSNRPYYCPFPGCWRTKRGRGFKRENEMIRHSNGHKNSLSYFCPFCQKEYLRPDNLQRHVRTHHPDKGKDDPQLRDELAKRPGEPNRRRRLRS